MNLGDKVKLVTFNGKAHSIKGVRPEEDYWKLLGYTGTIQQDPKELSINASFSKQKRVLVNFDTGLQSIGLITHNNLANSLWILESDLEAITE